VVFLTEYYLIASGIVVLFLITKLYPPGTMLIRSINLDIKKPHLIKQSPLYVTGGLFGIISYRKFVL